jgi:hypothetical protein
MDDILVGAETTREDEFALLTLGIPSAYHAMMMPHRISSLEYTLEQEYWLNDSNWIAQWMRFLTGATNCEVRQRPLIFKSSGHTFRVQATVRLFPSVRIIWMTRDPIDTFLSNRRMWRNLFERYALFEWEDESCLAQLHSERPD